jgi:hypothetical protein
MQLLSYCTKTDEVDRAYNKSKKRGKEHPGMASRLLHSQGKKLFTTLRNFAFNTLATSPWWSFHTTSQNTI